MMIEIPKAALVALGLCALSTGCAAEELPYMWIDLSSVELEARAEGGAASSVSAALRVSVGSDMGRAMVTVDRVDIYASPGPVNAAPLLELSGDFEFGFDRVFFPGQTRETTIEGFENQDLVSLCGGKYLVHVCVDAFATQAMPMASCDWLDDIPVDCR